MPRDTHRTNDLVDRKEMTAMAVLSEHVFVFVDERRLVLSRHGILAESDSQRERQEPPLIEKKKKANMVCKGMVRSTHLLMLL
jgi:hypothetical protein